MSALVRSLREHELEVDVFTAGTHPEGRLLIGPYGERVHLLVGTERAGTGLRRLFALVHFMIAVVLAGRRVDTNVVISDAPPTAAWASSVVARQTKSRFIYYLSDSWGAIAAESTSFLARLGSRLIVALENTALRSADLVIAVTGFMKSIAESAEADEIMLAENGIDTQVFVDIGAKWEGPTRHSRPYFLYAGNAGLVHGAEVFVDGAAELWKAGYDFDLVYMGYGAESAIGSKRLAQWADQVHVIDRQPPEVVAEAYRGAAGALSSIRPIATYADARPIKSLTGLACGCPVVFAGEGKFADHVKANDLGFVGTWSVSGARDAIREALDELAEAPDAHVRRRVQARAFAVQNYDERVAADLVVARVLAETRGEG